MIGNLNIIRDLPVAGGAAAWAPADLPNLKPTLQVARSRAAGGLWQDAGKTVPAAADGDPVRVATCPDTGADYAAPSNATRPLLWDEGGGKWSLFFDGVDDHLTYTPTWSGSVGSLAGRFYIELVTEVEVFATDTASNEVYVYLGTAYPRNFRANRIGPYTYGPSAGWQLSTQVSGASTYLVRGNGGVVVSTTPDWSAPNVLSVGRVDAKYLSGRVAGFIAAAAEWNGTTVGLVEAYLAALSP